EVAGDQWDHARRREGDHAREQCHSGGQQERPAGGNRGRVHGVQGRHGTLVPRVPGHPSQLVFAEFVQCLDRLVSWGCVLEGREADVEWPMEFAEYVAGQRPALMRFATVLSCQTWLAEDLVSDVLGRAFERWDRISVMAEPNAYVRRM